MAFLPILFPGCCKTAASTNQAIKKIRFCCTVYHDFKKCKEELLFQVIIRLQTFTSESKRKQLIINRITPNYRSMFVPLK